MAVLVAGAAVAATTLTALSAQATTNEVIPEEGFGGYRYWPTAVRSISAMWQIPVILRASGSGAASTWIGAQNDHGGYPFIQVGVTENMAFGNHFYFAFWSDSTVGFTAQPIFLAVHGGDTVAVAMERLGPKWHLSVHDLTTNKDLAVDVTYGAGARFTQGEWLQEDPVPIANAAPTDVPYPKLTGTRFSQVRLNGKVPTLTLSDGQTLMASKGVFQVPTPFVDDAFRLVAPEGYARQYLEDVYPLDMAIDLFNAQLVTWDDLSRGARLGATRGLIGAYAVFQRALARETWPLKTELALAGLVAANQAIIWDLTAWSARGLEKNSPLFVVFRHEQQGSEATQVRATLGLAPV
jgi:hypothetical protein